MTDLGITMTNDGKKHIQHAVAEAKRQCGWILRTFGTRQVVPMLTLWKSLVQCKLDYCSQLWCPTEKGDIQSIEMVQRSFLWKLTGMSQLLYWEQLNHLQLYSQERCTERNKVIYIWCKLEGQVPNITSADGLTSRIMAKWHTKLGRDA